MPENENQTNQDPEWFFETDDEKESGIETKKYDNGSILKRVKLSDGRVAVCRRLKGFDMQEITRQMAGKAENYQNAVMARSITIDEQKIVVDDITQVWMDDYTLLLSIASINFPSTRTALPS